MGGNLPILVPKPSESGLLKKSRLLDFGLSDPLLASCFYFDITTLTIELISKPCQALAIALIRLTEIIMIISSLASGPAAGAGLAKPHSIRLACCMEGSSRPHSARLRSERRQPKQATRKELQNVPMQDQVGAASCMQGKMAKPAETRRVGQRQGNSIS